MVNASLAKGTLAEGAIVDALRVYWPMAERRAKQGPKDRGDIGGVMPGLVIESKYAPKSYQIAEWLKECDQEVLNDNAHLGVVWFKLKGTTDPLRWPVMMRGGYFVKLLRTYDGAHR